MAQLEYLIVENFRCFSDRHEIPLAPLTLLVGENSTGKSTVLAAARLAWDAVFSQTVIDFNEEPFPLGSFRDMANYRGGKAGRVDSFTLGYKFPVPARFKAAFGEDATSISVTAEFMPVGTKPELASWRVKAGTLDLAWNVREGQICISPGGSRWPIPEQFRGRHPNIADLAWYVRYAVQRAGTPDGQGRLDVETERLIDRLEGIAEMGTAARWGRPRALAPIRTNPRRTYEPMRDSPRPSGDHVPYVIAQSWSKAGEEGRGLAEGMKVFGGASGLFNALDVKNLDKAGNVFQIRVKLAGPLRNLVDVGYGVSQVLPVLVDSILGKRRVLLVQQPEVHLHPRAQAALGSFFCTLALSGDSRIVIETHSDYLIDRVRMEVRNGSTQSPPLDPDRVRLIYFEREDVDVVESTISVDALGNLVGAPPGYREFFLEETQKLFG